VADDDNLDLKKRARRRLVGAAALALLAAVVLPIVMDQEPHEATEDVQIQIPPQEGENFAARNITPPAESAAAVAEPDTATSDPVPAEPEQAPAPPVVVAPAPNADAAPVPSRQAPAKQESPAPSEAARAAAILNGQLAPAAQAAGAVIQLGAYKDAASARALRDKLKAAGFAAYTEKAGEATRVRVGPFAARDEAEAIAAKLAKAGYSGIVTSR
jgi:DedD protein